jgi:hypothetical protein
VEEGQVSGKDLGTMPSRTTHNRLQMDASQIQKPLNLACSGLCNC